MIRIEASQRGESPASYGELNGDFMGVTFFLNGIWLNWIFWGSNGIGCESPTIWLGIVPKWDSPAFAPASSQVKRKEGSISVWNNGAGLPVQAPTGHCGSGLPWHLSLSKAQRRQMHREHQCYVPELVFGLGPDGMGAPLMAHFWSVVLFYSFEKMGGSRCFH